MLKKNLTAIFFHFIRIERWASIGNDLSMVRALGAQKATNAKKVVVATFLKFSFQMDSIILNLSKGLLRFFLL